MNGILSILAFILVTTFIGINIALFVYRENRTNILELLGLSYLFGIAAITIEMFIIGLFGLKFTIINILFTWIILIAFNVITQKNFPRLIKIVKIRTYKFNKLEILLLFFLLFIVLYTFFRAMIKPMSGDDSIAIWGLKAKIIFLANTLPKDFFTFITAKFPNPHPDYPFLLPFSEVWFYTFMREFNDYLVKILFPLNFLAFLMFFYSLLKRSIHDRTLSLLFTFILASINIFNRYATTEYADLQMSIYGAIAFISFFIWAKENKFAYLLIANLSSIFAFWTKNEGSITLMAIILLSVFYIFESKFKNRIVTKESVKLALLSLFLIFIFLGWILYKNHARIQNDVIYPGLFKNLNPCAVFSRIKPIFYQYQLNIFGVKHWNLIWVFFIYCLIKNPKIVFSASYKYLTMPIFFILGIYTCIYFITPYDIKWHLATSSDRLLLHVLPLIVFYSALVVDNDISSLPRRPPNDKNNVV